MDGLDLSVGEGELLTLLGPSGCGKTTVLRLVAGFESPDGGTVRFRGDDVTAQGARRRGFGMVFQNYALFPHLDVFENVAFGLRSRKRPEPEVRRRVEEALSLVDLPGLGGRRVQQLSGGQQQRVALARALAVEPPLLLLDEPLSNLDAALRERTRRELRLLVKELGITTLFVTHDQEEAFDLSDRVAVMKAGRLRQVGTPGELYHEPIDPFVAGFVGRANRLPVRVSRAGDGRAAVLGDGTEWPLPAGAAPAPGTGDAGLELWVRPDDLVMSAEPGGAGGEEGKGAGGWLSGRVRDRRFRGAVTTYRVETGAGGLLEVTAEADAAEPGDRVRLRPDAGARVQLFRPGESDLPPGARGEATGAGSLDG